MKYLIWVILLGLVLFLFTSMGTAIAQASTPPQVVYFLASDTAHIQQIFQMLLDEQQEARQITHATSDVISFGAAYDGLAVAYVSAGQLWLQPIHTDEPLALAALSANHFFTSPIFSQDGQYIAYPDNGLWLLDLSTRETRQLLEDSPLTDATENPNEFRQYQPKQFVLDEAGKAVKLIVDVTLAQWNSEGIYDLTTKLFETLPSLVGTDTRFMPEGLPLSDLLPLADGRVLVYGSLTLDEVTFYIADSLNALQIDDPTLFTAALPGVTLYPNQAIERAPGSVRIFGRANSTDAAIASAFYVDFSVASHEIGDVQIIPLAKASESDFTVVGDLSPDGRLAPVYLNASFTDAGTLYGELVLRPLTGELEVMPNIPEIIGRWTWQRLS